MSHERAEGEGQTQRLRMRVLRKQLKFWLFHPEREKKNDKWQVMIEIKRRKTLKMREKIFKFLF